VGAGCASYVVCRFLSTPLVFAGELGSSLHQLTNPLRCDLSMSELDDALERLHHCGFEYAEGLPNCGPMAVEALESLGHPALIPGLVDIYAPRLPELAPGQDMPDAARLAARGRFERVEDWLASYERDLARLPWPEVLSQSAGVIAQGCETPAAPSLVLHALIRVGHAVRSLSRVDNLERRRELACGLAYWTARCGPVNPPAPDIGWMGPVGPIPDSVNDWSHWLSSLCCYGAERFLSASDDHRVTHALGVTASSAFRFLIPHLPAEVSRSLLDEVLSSIVAIFASQVPARTADEFVDLEVDRCAESLSEVRYRAACSVQEHAIMMAEACVRENALAPDATLRRAAATAALRLSPPGYKEWR
jgi:hypothetical protein